MFNRIEVLENKGIEIKSYEENPCAYSAFNGGSCMNDCIGCWEAEEKLVKTTTLINLTPHTVTLLKQNLNILTTIPSSGNAVRCSQQTINTGFIGDIPITSTTFGEVIGLPEEKEGVYYIVSRLVMSACPNRKDLLVPNELQKDDTERIIGCLSLTNN